MSSIKNLCENIEKLMLTHHDEQDLLYENVMKELPTVNYSVIFTQLNELTLYRVRLNNEKHDPYVNIQDLFYAPAKFVSSYGRVNTPGQSMFYTSEFSTICDLELLYDYLLNNDIGHQRYATCSQWEIKKNLNMLILAIAPSNREFVNGFTLRNQCFEFVKSEPQASQETYSNFYSLTKHFFLKNAKMDKNVYVVCSAISNYFSRLFPSIDGVIYPTVQGNTGYNIVLRPDALDKKMLEPKTEVSMNKWLVTNKSLMTVDPLSSKMGKIIDDKIHWT